MGRPPTPTPPRRLLARLRDVMAGGGTAHERLHQVATLIAGDMVAEVCSVYVRRPGDVLELFATQGLKPSAVHMTRLTIGEGLVGYIAESAHPVALSDAQSHPQFAYRPETGEEAYHSLMGVPIQRGGRVIGVLVVQNRTKRSYSEEEIETLQTVAMVLAEMVAGGELLPRDEMQAVESDSPMPLRVEGMKLVGGRAMGVAILHQPKFEVTRLVADNTGQEHERLRRAVSDMHGALDDLLASKDLAGGGEHQDVLESYRMIAEDAGWLKRIDEAIEAGLTAEAAVQRVQTDIRNRMRQVSDPYLRERIHDLEDLATRLLGHLIGGTTSFSNHRNLPDDSVVIARTMGPAQLLDYDRTRLKGVVLEEGSPTSHCAIVARAMGVPVVGYVKGVLGLVQEGDTVLLDADQGLVFVRPGDEALQLFQDSLKALEVRKASYAAVRDLPAVTLDGVPINVYINAGMTVDLQLLHESGADGVGLYRTEVPFMVRSVFPNVSEQHALYARIFDGAEGKPVVFRTLDIGGDKALPYWKHDEEENPAMGWRAVRLSLDLPAMLRQQLRAMIRAADGRELRVMFPMIAEVAEFERAKAILTLELQRAERRGETLPAAVRTGVMLEVPALLMQFHALLPRIDFLSIGSNDLLQFLFASDRGHPMLADRYDTLSPPVLTTLRQIIRQCDKTGVTVSLCGEMAGNPLDAMALIGLGMRNISIAPSAVGPVKMMIRSMRAAGVAEYVDSLCDLPDHSVREMMRTFARDHQVEI